ncbi:DUF4097 family beta strand repeat-containing protein [Mucilaginibacter auburnensis]|uniref:Adhesin domain-containing protein n=1 Tax=Mucilaginibacter auburnensis TaxID=1457233 RepID=A0A2H9VTS3_9SPHI|nr:hypothetical protein [Mucilaginibacter auburnensis]PJJ84199.1 hypothetical protein CLV57_1209 [Mucilaginibacter auburnensis]
MKKILWILLLAVCGNAFAQKKGEFTASSHISKQFTLKATAAKTKFAVYNTFGSITIEGYNGNEVIIEAEQTIRANTTEDLEKGKIEFKADFIQTADSIIAYNAKPENNRPEFRAERARMQERPRYYVQLNYTVKVPNNINLRAVTINNGNISINNVYGVLNIDNVNGSINITNAKGATDATTVNGQLTATFLAVPADASHYKTINGKIEVTYPITFAGDVQYKSFNGQFYTNFENTQSVVTDATKQKNNSGETVYKLNKNNRLRIGNGGKLSTFETLNGNIYLKKI